MLKKRLPALTAGLLSVLLCGALALPAGAAPAKLITTDPAEIQKDCAASANILKDANWNFEDEEKFWRLTNTVDGLGSAYYYSMAITDDNPHEGKCSLMLDGVGGWSNIQVPFNVKKNTKYTFSMWVHASEGWNGSKGSVVKMVGHPEGDYLKAGPSITGDLGFNYTGEWYQFAFVIDTGEYDLVSLYLADGGGTIYFDELRFFETDNPDGEAAAGPANLKKIQEQEARENPPATTAPTPDTTTTAGGGEGSTMTGGGETTASQAPQDTTTTKAGGTTAAPLSGTTSSTGGSGGGNPLAIVLIVAAVVIILGGGGFALWYFKLRKKPDAPDSPQE